MKTIIILIAILIVGGVAWLIGSSLSSDALGMALGMFLGVLSGIPTALLVLVAGRRRADDYDDYQAPPPSQLYIYAPPPAQLPPAGEIVDAQWRRLPANTQR